MRKLCAIGGSLAALAAAVGLMGAPAAAGDDWETAPPPDARLELTITSTAAVADSPDRVSLTCDPDGGSHPTPGDACDSLRAVDGHFERLPPLDDTYCPMVYDPVRVAATGTWGERAVSYTEVFSNRCFAAVGTDGVFGF